jgi:hypothetical protein
MVRLGQRAGSRETISTEKVGERDRTQPHARTLEPVATIAKSGRCHLIVSSQAAAIVS